MWLCHFIDASPIVYLFKIRCVGNNGVLAINIRINNYLNKDEKQFVYFCFIIAARAIISRWSGEPV